MKISTYKVYKGDNGVCMTRYTPIDWEGEVYSTLCPSSSLMLSYKLGKIDYSDFEASYRKTVLSKLDAKKVYTDLKGKVLLTSDDKMFSFKYIIAQWIEEELGIKVEELK